MRVCVKGMDITAGWMLPFQKHPGTATAIKGPSIATNTSVAIIHIADLMELYQPKGQEHV